MQLSAPSNLEFDQRFEVRMTQNSLPDYKMKVINKLFFLYNFFIIIIFLFYMVSSWAYSVWYATLRKSTTIIISKGSWICDTGTKTIENHDDINQICTLSQHKTPDHSQPCTIEFLLAKQSFLHHRIFLHTWQYCKQDLKKFSTNQMWRTNIWHHARSSHSIYPLLVPMILEQLCIFISDELSQSYHIMSYMFIAIGQSVCYLVMWAYGCTRSTRALSAAVGAMTVAAAAVAVVNITATAALAFVTCYVFKW